MSLPKQLLFRCPSCYRNFLNLYCAFTCDPYQSKFLGIDVMANNRSIDSVNYVVSHDFAYGMFNSCQDVQMPSNNQKAIDTLCGSQNPCTPENWLHYMGDKNNHQAPFGINFILNNSFVDIPGTLRNHNRTYRLWPMNDKVNPCNGTCSCQDCRASCSHPIPPYTPPTPCTMFHMPCSYFIALFAFCSFAVLFLLCQLACCAFRSCQRAHNYGHLEQDYIINGHSEADSLTVPIVAKTEISCCDTAGSSLEAFLNGLFRRWGFWCASHPFLVVSVCVIICGALSAGITKFKVFIQLCIKLYFYLTSQRVVLLQKLGSGEQK